jgi:regulatory protein
VSDKPPEDPLQRALGIAYRYLNRRERTVAEVQARLEREALDETAVAAAVTMLIEDGYLDDCRYARVFAEDKRRLDEWGSERIRRTLQARGVGRDTIEQALSAQGPESELEQALVLLRRRFPHPPVERRERDRALGMMLRKGYDSELAVDALAAYARQAST